MEDKLLIAKTIMEDNMDLLLDTVAEFSQLSESILSILDESELESYKQNLYKNSLLEYMAFLNVYEDIPLDESMMQYIDASGQRKQRKDRKTRSIMANKDPDRNKIDRMVSQIKGSKTRKSKLSTQTRGNRKRGKTMRKRRGLNIER